MSRETRRYTILDLIGRGGQGNVYRARLQNAEGFRKEVALKLLKEGLSEESLQRFRDEARILGLVRDRAIIAVDPPIQLAGRWALVMELADGLSTQQLLARSGPLPVSVALEVVAEIGRVLDKLYHMQGPDGAQLKLLHRDIKPANIQITVEGEVKLLDFGVARADFEERETHTVQHIGGTFGFIAPERLRGVNTPACDIFSLGVTLRVLLTGEKPVTMGPATLASISPSLYDAIAFAEDMRREDPEQRPSAKEVAARAVELRARAEGPSLSQWASTAIPRLARKIDDPLVGSVLTESFDLGERLSVDSQKPPRPAGLPPQTVRQIAAASGVLLLVVWLAAVGVLALIAKKVLATEGEAPVLASAQPIEPAAPASPAPLAPVAPAPPESVAPAPPEPALEAPRLQEPVPAVARPAPPPEQPQIQKERPIELVEFDAVRPVGVWVDDKWLGTTPLRDLPLSAGTHRIRVVAADRIIEATVLVGGRRGATRFYWDGGATLGTR